MLSLHTNSSSLFALNGLHKSTDKLSVSQQRIGTGYRVNSAMDDAAGLQIATRLNAQSSGMGAAMHNTQNSISMLQAGDALLGEIGDMLTRMSDLAVQASDGSYSQADRDAMDSEYDSLSKQIFSTMNDAQYAGQPLFRYVVDSENPGTLGKGPIQFQIGASSSEVVTEDFRGSLGNINAALYFSIDNGRLFGFPPDGPNTQLDVQSSASQMIGALANARDQVQALRSRFGALSNRLQFAYDNLSSMQVNTKNAQGRIVDTDFATETAEATTNQMLMQAGTAMLKQSNSMSQLVMSLVQ